jgi:spermidine synthase
MRFCRRVRPWRGGVSPLRLEVARVTGLLCCLLDRLVESPDCGIPKITMKPFRKLAETQTADGERLTLHEHDGEHYIKLNGQPLMSTTATASEVSLAELACASLRDNDLARVLIGGLGMGFTLRGVLERVGRGAVVDVAELIPEVVSWNRDYLEGINGALLNDPRVDVKVADVFDVMTRAGNDRYDAVLLDVDNGPVAMVQEDNARLYSARGLRSITEALAPRGCVGFWSASSDRSFLRRLTKAGFEVDVHAAKAYERAKRASHTIYIARCR